MEYRRFENTVIVRMDRNEDLFAELKKVALKENITSQHQRPGHLQPHECGSL